MAFVQKGTAAVAFGAATCTPSLTLTTANNLLVLTVYWANPGGSAAPVTPPGWSVGLAPTGFATRTGGGYFTGAAIYYKISAGGTQSGVVNSGGSGAWALNGIISEYSGYLTSGVLDVTASAGTATFSTSGSVGPTATTAQANELVIACFAGPQVNSSANIALANPISGYTTIDVQQNNQNHAVGIAGYAEVTSTGTQSASETWTQTGEWAAVIATFNAAGVSGAISGTSALTLGQTGALTGSGALAGTTALTFNQTGAVTGAGALSGTSALAFGQSATLTAAGILAGSSALSFAQTATLAATGALAGTSALTFGASATADVPAGALQGTAALSFGGSGTLTAFGALIGACQILIDASGTLTQPDSGKAGPVDSPRISDTAFRRKRKRKALEPEQPAFIASFERAPPQAVIDRVPDFTTLAQRLGQSQAALSVRIDREIEHLMYEQAERDDEEALVLILTALEQE